MSNPIAMPKPYGYVYDKGYNVCSHAEAELFDKAREAAKRADLSAGQKDGDVLSKQVGGTHYKKGVQPWTIAMDWGLDPWSHNVVKYILRFPYKEGKKDLEKIAHYLEFLIENYDEIKAKYY